MNQVTRLLELELREEEHRAERARRRVLIRLNHPHRAHRSPSALKLLGVVDAGNRDAPASTCHM